ncbi:MAG: SURF1 family protein [Gammaproteobacteria bacterium]|nr:SURF1 family protein [Gammaproteobacteria bacterium]
MKTGKRQFRDLLVPVIAFALLLPLLVSLSLWQYMRGEEKSARWEEFDSGGNAVVQLGPDNLSTGFDVLPQYQRVAVEGRYLSEYQVLLDNRPEQGRPGWHVLTPFRIAGTDTLLLVDRGWLPKETGKIPQIAIDGDLREISGRLATLPQPGLALEPGQPPETWPKPMQFPEVSDVAGELAASGVDAKVLPRVLWLDEAARDGFARDWQPEGLPPERHYAYSFQWLALAITLVIIFIILLRRWWRKPPTAE